MVHSRNRTKGSRPTLLGLAHSSKHPEEAFQPDVGPVQPTGPTATVRFLLDVSSTRHVSLGVQLDPRTLVWISQSKLPERSNEPDIGPVGPSGPCSTVRSTLHNTTSPRVMLTPTEPRHNGPDPWQSQSPVHHSAQCHPRVSYRTHAPWSGTLETQGPVHIFHLFSISFFTT